MSVKSLDVPLRDQIDALFRDARARMNEGKKDESVALARKAWDLFPEPRFGWDVTQSYTIAMAAILRDAGLLQEALQLIEADFASGVVLKHQDQPRIMLGSIYAEMGDRERAKRWIGEANLLSRGRCFFGMWLKYRSYVD
jgi:tetratricopeptide (TPR) repeat protein